MKKNKGSSHLKNVIIIGICAKVLSFKCLIPSRDSYFYPKCLKINFSFTISVSKKSVRLKKSYTYP